MKIATRWHSPSRAEYRSSPPEFVNFILSLPEDYIVGRDGTSKAVFRHAMRGIVPDCILDRRDKVGFATPEQTWLLRLQDWVQQNIELRQRQTPFLSLI